MNGTTYANGFVGKKTKVKKNKWRADMRTAHDKGYAKGWEEAYNIPNRFGSRLAAAYGYTKGVKDRFRADNYIKQYNRQGKLINYGGSNQ